MKKHRTPFPRNEGWLKPRGYLAGAFGIAVAARAGLSLGGVGFWKNPEPSPGNWIAVAPDPADAAAPLPPIPTTLPAPPSGSAPAFSGPNANPGSQNTPPESIRGEPAVFSQPQPVRQRPNETAPMESRETPRAPSAPVESNRSGGVPAPPAPVIGRIPPPRPTPKPTPTPVFSPL